MMLLWTLVLLACVSLSLALAADSTGSTGVGQRRFRMRGLCRHLQSFAYSCAAPLDGLIAGTGAEVQRLGRDEARWLEMLRLFDLCSAVKLERYLQQRWWDEGY